MSNLLQSSMKQRKSRRLLHTALSVAVTLVGLALLFVSARAAPAAAPSSGALMTIGDDTSEDFYRGAFYRTGVSRRPAPQGDGNGELRLLAVGIAGDWHTDANPDGLPEIKAHTAEIFRDLSGNEHVYVIGGQSTGISARDTIFATTIQTSTISNQPDRLGSWTQLSTSLPEGRYNHESVIVGNYLYVIGGIDSNGIVTDTVYYAEIDPHTGEIGPFASTSPLPVEAHADCIDLAPPFDNTGRAQLAAAVISDTIYVIGGQPGDLVGTSCVFYAKPAAEDGSITSWQRATADFPTPVYGNTAVAHNGVLYGLGGSDAKEDVYYARPTADGDITVWQAGTHDQNTHHRSVAVSYSGQILMIGGAINGRTTAQNTVNAILVNPDGSLDQWISGEPLSEPRFLHDAVVSSRGWIYVIGGAPNQGANATDSIDYGTVSGEASQYAPWGQFTSRAIALDKKRPLKELRWVTYMTNPGAVTATVEYRFSDTPTGLGNAPWQGPFSSDAVSGVHTNTQELSNEAAFFQYRIRMGTTQTDTTPIFQRVQLVYEVPSPDLGVSKSTNVSVAGPGTRITYTISYQSILSDSAPATGVRITETIPPFVDFVSAAPLTFSYHGKEPNGDKRYVATIPGEVLPTVSGTLSFVVRVTDTLAALPFHETNPTITNTVEIGDDGTHGTDLAQANNRHQLTTPLALVNLTLTKANNPQGVVEPGDEIEYTLSYSNTSPYLATNVVIEDPIPSYTSYVAGSATGPVDTSLLPTKLRWNIGNLAPHTGGVVRFRVRVDTDLEGLDGDFENRATIWSDQTVPIQSHAVVNTLQTTEVLVLSKEVFPPIVQAGDLMTFTIHYTNTGNVDLEEVVITDPVPLNTTYVTGTIKGPGANDSNVNQLKWNVGTVATGASGLLQFQVRVKKPLPVGAAEIQNIALAETKTIPPFESLPVIATIGSQPKLKISKSASPSSGISPGDLITFTIAYTNVGDIGADGIVITDRLPANTTLVDAGGATLTNGVLRWTLPSDKELPGLGGSGQVQFSVRVGAAVTGGISNDSYRITSRQGAGATGVPVYVPVGADFVPVRLAATSTTFRPNEPVTILLDVTNKGQDPSVGDPNWGLWVDLYVKTSPTPPASPLELSNVNTFWYVFGNEIANGKVKKLRSDDVSSGPGASPFTTISTPGVYYVYAQVNTAPDGTSLAGQSRTSAAASAGLYPIPEWPDTNNIIGPLVLTVTNAIAPAPKVTSVTPSSVAQSDAQRLTIRGSNFNAGARVWLQRDGDQRTGYAVTVKNSSEIGATFDLAGQLPGTWDVVVQNPDLGTGVLVEGLKIVEQSNDPEEPGPEGPGPGGPDPEEPGPGEPGPGGPDPEEPGPGGPICPPDCRILLPVIKR